MAAWHDSYQEYVTHFGLRRRRRRRCSAYTAAAVAFKSCEKKMPTVAA